MARKMKKEKHITQRTYKGKSGNRDYLQVTIRLDDGKQFSKVVYIDEFETPKMAMEQAKKIRDEALLKKRHGYTLRDFPTVKELFEETFTVLKKLSPRTVKQHRLVYDKVICQFGNKTIDKITSADIQMCLNQYAENHAQLDVSRVLSVWRRIYKVCAMKNINVIDRTIAVSMPRCKQAKHISKEISRSDLEQFLEALWDYNKESRKGRYKSRRLWYAIRIMSFTGLRPAECFALTKKDIDLISDKIHVNKAVRSSEKNGLELGATKTEQSVRSVPIPSELKPYLKDCIENSQFDLLFTDISGNLFNIDDISNLVNRVSKKASKINGKEIKFHLYDCRHQFATDLFQSGVNPTNIRDLMGHESSSMSLGYTVSNDASRQEAIESRKFS